jgi:hypothetical protein
MSYPSEAFREAKHVKDKWEKLRKQYYKEKKLHNVSGDIAGSSCVWYGAMDAMLSETAKANRVPGAIDQGTPVSGTQNAPVYIDNDITPPVDTEDERVSRAAQLLGIRGWVNMKR